jgi:ABC-type transport system involved in cytochrome c biogenesis permease component
MMSLPIVERELRMAPRHPLTYRVRFYAALIMIGLAFFILAVGPSGRSLSSLAQTFFAILTVVAFGYALLAGAFFTADCLSVEKRDGTLGLLFLTDLTGADVVLGKLAATSLHAFYGLLAVFPVLALPLLMGGITGGEFWRVLLVLVNTLLISLAVGLLVSVLTRGERQAVGTTLTAVGAIAGGLPALYKLLESRLSLGGFEPWLLYPSPGVGLRFAFDAAYRSGGAHYFWGSMLTLLLLSLGCVALATLILSRSSHEVTGSVASGGWRGGWQRWRWGGPTRHCTVRQRELERRPFLWLVDRDRLPKISSGVFGLAALGFGLWAWFEITSTNSRDFVVAMYATFVIHLMLKIPEAGEACWHLNAARRGRVLETLLVTPLTVKEILRDQVIALRRRFLWPGIALCLLNLIFLAIIIRHARPAFDPHEIGIFTRLSLGGILMLACDFYALSWV